MYPEEELVKVFPEYVCHVCGASGIKLWREYLTANANYRFLCWDCMDDTQKVPGRHYCVSKLSDGSITMTGFPGSGDMVPAVPFKNQIPETKLACRGYDPSHYTCENYGWVRLPLQTSGPHARYE